MGKSILGFLYAMIVLFVIITMVAVGLKTTEDPAAVQARVEINNQAFLPIGATDIVIHKAYYSNTIWKTFKWQGQCFLIRQSGQSAVLTTIKCQKDIK